MVDISIDIVPEKLLIDGFKNKQELNLMKMIIKSKIGCHE